MEADKLEKVLALISSDHDGEALAAVRMAKKMLQTEGLELGLVIQAGLVALKNPSDPSLALDRYSEVFDAIKAAAERRSEHHNARRDQTRYSRAGAAGDIPEGIFEAHLSLTDEDALSGPDGLTLLRSRIGDAGDVIQLPTLAAKGRIADKIRHALDVAGADTITAMIKVRAPFQPGDFPIITNFR